MSNLRNKALKLLDNYENYDYSSSDIKELIHELNVYQIELELQNQELREKENILLESQAELTLLFMDAPIGYIVLDDKFCTIKYNIKASEIFGFKTNALNPYIYSSFKDLSQIESFLEWTKSFSKKTFEIEIRDKRDVFKWIELSHVKSNFNTKDIHLYSVVDITKKRLRSEKLHIFGTILEQLPVGVIITDIDARIVYVNKEICNDLGYSEDEMIGKTPSLFKSNYTSESEYKTLWDTITEGKTWKGIFKNNTKDGEVHSFASAISPISDSQSNKITHFISVETNIDEKILMAKTLEAQENIMLIQARHAAMGEMIAIIAHQWRQPLSIISTIASGICMQKELEEPDSSDDFDNLKDIIKTTQYLSKTIDDFQNFFKKDKKLIEISSENVIEKVLGFNKKAFKDNQIEVEFINRSLIKIYTYENELLQVIINIINNAKDALLLNTSIKSKKIIIRTYDESNITFIEISDNAGGIPIDFMDKIFEPYFTTKESLNGTGLGLYISKTIIEKHLQGSIKVVNNDLGALFTLSIPSSNI